MSDTLLEDISGRPVVLSFGGFDPSAGAGVLQDVKVAEAKGCFAVSALSSVTFQNDQSFSGLRWCEQEEVERQLESLFERFSPVVMKLALLQGETQLELLFSFLKKQKFSGKIVWDPVLSASAGALFHEKPEKLQSFLSGASLLCPNAEEACKIAQVDSPFQAGEVLSQSCPVFVTGVREGSKIFDVFFEAGEERSRVALEALSGHEKHGSGCCYSMGIACDLAQGKPLEECLKNAASFTREFLKSSENLFGVFQRRAA